MARAPYVRHARHRSFSGVDRGRARVLKDFLNARADTAASGGIGDTAATVNFTANNANEQLTAAGHGLTEGQGPIVLSSSGTLPAGLTDTDLYWVHVVDANTITLRASRDSTTDVDFTTNGSGTHSFEFAATVPALQEYLKQGINSHQIQGLTDIDDVANLH